MKSRGNPEPSSKRALGVTSATALVVASMIGTGVFTTSGFLLADLRSRWAVLGAWIVGGALAALGALCYAALARRIPESGGEYTFLSRTIHPAAGYVAGWISLFVGFSAPLAAAAFGFGSYTRDWFNNAPPQVSGTFLILLFAALHSWRVQRGASFQNWIVAAKVALIVGLIAFGFGKLSFDIEPGPPLPSIGAFAVSVVWVSFSYMGWNAAVYIGGEITDPKRNLPKAIYLGTTLVTALYISLNAVFLFSAPFDQLAGQLEIGRIAGRALGGPALAEAVTVLIVLGLVTTVSAMIMAGPRVYARMADDGYLPAALASGEGPPRVAIALQASIAIIMLWTSSFDGLLTYIGFTLNLSAAATVVGLMRQRIREGASLRVAGWPWVPALFLVGVLWLTVFAIARRPLESLLGLSTIALGWIVWRWRHAHRSPQWNSPA